jgi:hypothetical protein
MLDSLPVGIAAAADVDSVNRSFGHGGFSQAVQRVVKLPGLDNPADVLTRSALKCEALAPKRALKNLEQL